MLTGGERNDMPGDLAGGYYVKPTVFKGHNKMRIFQEEIFGPVVSVTTFKDDAEALAIANDTLYGLGAGVWSRDANRCYRFGRAIQAGRVWTNCYHAYPAHAAFGGYKQSGIGRENHRMMLDHYQQTKNMLVSYSPKKLGLLLSGSMDVTTASTASRRRRRRSPCSAEIQAEHGPVLFHQSGGCCDGSSPMCYPVGDFIVGDARRAPGRDRRRAGLHRRRAVRGLAPHPADHRRGARPRRDVLARQRPGGPLPDALARALIRSAARHRQRSTQPSRNAPTFTVSSHW